MLENVVWGQTTTSSWVCATRMNSGVNTPADLTYSVSTASYLMHFYRHVFFGLGGVQEEAKTVLSCVIFSHDQLNLILECDVFLSSCVTLNTSYVMSCSGRGATKVTV